MPEKVFQRLHREGVDVEIVCGVRKEPVHYIESEVVLGEAPPLIYISARDECEGRVSQLLGVEVTQRRDPVESVYGVVMYAYPSEAEC